MAPASSTLGIKLDLETRERLRRLGELKDRSPHWIMKTAIEEYLEREERLERERLEDQERWERYVHTGAFVDDEDMMRHLDSLARQAHRKIQRR